MPLFNRNRWMEFIEKASETYIETERELRQKAHRGTLSEMHVHQSVYLSLCMSVSLSLCPSVCLSTCLPSRLSVSVRLSLRLPTCLCVCLCLSVCLSVSVRPSVFLTSYLRACTSVCVYLSVFLSTCLSVSLSVCLYVNVCLKKRIIALEFSTCVGVFCLTFSTFILLILSAFNQDRRNRKTQSHFYRGCWFNCLWSKWWVLSWESLVTA